MGKTIEEALKLTNKAVMEALDGLPPVKVHCSVLAEQAIKAAVADYYRKQGIDPTPFCGRDPRVRGVRLRSVIKIDPRPGRLGVVSWVFPAQRGHAGA